MFKFVFKKGLCEVEVRKSSLYHVKLMEGTFMYNIPVPLHVPFMTADYFKILC